MKKENIFLIIGAFLGAITVIIGAFGAHSLHSLLLENGRIETFKTAVDYQFYHTIGILIIGFVYRKNVNRLIKWAGLCMAVGIFLFSGSLYILSISNNPMLGAIAPIGGLFFITGWLFLAIGLYKEKK